MRHVTIVATVLALLATVAAAEAQMKPMTPPAQTQGQAPAKPQSPAAQQHHPQSQQPMMGSMMGGPVDMSDPKAAARTLKLRGEIMKAVGEAMLKHAEALAQEK